jgi:hypothetical protein
MNELANHIFFQRIYVDDILIHYLFHMMKIKARYLVCRYHHFLDLVRVPRRVNSTCRFGRFRSDPHRISSESDIFHKKPIGFDKNSVGSDRNFFDPTGSDPLSVTWVICLEFEIVYHGLVLQDYELHYSSSS